MRVLGASQGNEAFAQGNYPEAVKRYTMVLNLDAQNMSGYINRSAAQLNMHRYQVDCATHSDCNAIAHLLIVSELF